VKVLPAVNGATIPLLSKIKTAKFRQMAKMASQTKIEVCVCTADILRVGEVSRGEKML